MSLVVADYRFHMKLETTILLLASLSNAAEYIPGTPGAVWSDEEVRIVRLKVLELITKDPTKKNEMFREFDIAGHRVSDSYLLRLAFHDCLPYEDGSPGCK